MTATLPQKATALTEVFGNTWIWSSSGPMFYRYKETEYTLEIPDEAPELVNVTAVGKDGKMLWFGSAHLNGAKKAYQIVSEARANFLELKKTLKPGN